MTPTVTPPSPKGELDITGRRMVQQFSTLLPQIHLTLVSILQGLALVVLFTNSKPPASFSWNDITSALSIHHWYLPHLVSLLIVVTAWIEYVYGVLSLYWPVRAAWITIQFLVVVPEVAAFSSVDAIGPWLFWIGFIVLFGGISSITNRQVVSKSLLKEEHWKLMNHHYSKPHYFVMAIVFPMLGWLRVSDSALFATTFTLPLMNITVPLATLFDFVMPVAVLFITLTNLRLDDRYFDRIVEAVLSDDHSLYAMRSGIIHHRS